MAPISNRSRPRVARPFVTKPPRLSAVPFLGTLAARPLVASVDRVLRHRQWHFELPADVARRAGCVVRSGAVARAGAWLRGARSIARSRRPRRRRQAVAPDVAVRMGPAVEGRSRRQRHSLASRPTISPPRDRSAARSRPWSRPNATRRASRAFVGPAFLPSTEPLASLGGALNGIRLDGRHVSNLFFSGPGAGPDVTAATLARRCDPGGVASSDGFTSGRQRRSAAGVSVVAGDAVVSARDVSRRVAAGKRGRRPRRRSWPARRSRRRSRDGAIHAGSSSARRAGANVDAAIAKLSSTHRIDAVAFRRI